AEALAVLARHAAVSLEPVERVISQYRGPQVRIVAGRVGAAPYVCEVAAAITRRNQRIVDMILLEGVFLERVDILLRRIGGQRVPRLVEQRGGDVLGGRKTF